VAATDESPGGVFIAAALALPGMLPGAAGAQGAPEDGFVAFRYLDYRDWQPGANRMTVQSPSVFVLKPLSDALVLEGALDRGRFHAIVLTRDAPIGHADVPNDLSRDGVGTRAYALLGGSRARSLCGRAGDCRRGADRGEILALSRRQSRRHDQSPGGTRICCDRFRNRRAVRVRGSLSSDE
jgi:hypothetical protein